MLLCAKNETTVLMIQKTETKPDFRKWKPLEGSVLYYRFM